MGSKTSVLDGFVPQKHPLRVVGNKPREAPFLRRWAWRRGQLRASGQTLGSWPPGFPKRPIVSSKPSSGQFPGSFKYQPRLTHTEVPVHILMLFIDARPGSGHQEPLETGSVPASSHSRAVWLAGAWGIVPCPTLQNYTGQISGHGNSGAPAARQPTPQSGVLACRPCPTHPPPFWKALLCPHQQKRLQKGLGILFNP